MNKDLPFQFEYRKNNAKRLLRNTAVAPPFPLSTVVHLVDIESPRNFTGKKDQ